MLAGISEFLVYLLMIVVLVVLAQGMRIVIDEIAKEAEIVWAQMAVTVEDVPLAYYTRDKAWFLLAKLRYKNHNTLHTCLKLYNVVVYLDEDRSIL